MKRVLSRNHPEIDEGWLCDKGRFANRAPLRGGPDHRAAAPRDQRGLEEISWDDALDDAERLLRAAGTHIVTALSGTETVEQAYSLGRLVRGGLGAHNAVFPEEVSDALDPFRLPLSAIRDAQIVVVVGDDSVLERAPIVDLWLRAARPQGRRGSRKSQAPSSTRRSRIEMRAAERAILIWSGPHGEGGLRVAALATALGLARPSRAPARSTCPSTPNGRGVCEAWAAADDSDDTDPHPIGLLIVSGDEAAADPAVRALAERAEAVIAVTMFHGLAVGWADLVLPGTSNLERDGTLVNLEGRAQRLRRTVLPPVPDELAWLSKLAARFDVAVSPHAPVVFDELSPRIFGGATFGAMGDHAPLPPATPVEDLPPLEPANVSVTAALRLQRYTPLFSGAAVERTPELHFQRPAPEIELARADAESRGIGPGDEVVVSSNGTSVTLRARLSRTQPPGVARVAEEHAGALPAGVEVRRA